MTRRKLDRFEQNRGVNMIDALEDRYQPNFSIEEIRKNMRMNYRNDFWLDETKRPKNMVYSWPAISILGMDNEGGWRQNLRDGWSLVPPSRHPEISTPDIFGREDSAKRNYIKVRNHVLMERPVELHNEAVAITAEKSLEALTRADALEKFTGMSRYDIGIKQNDTHIGGARQFN